MPVRLRMFRPMALRSPVLAMKEKGNCSSLTMAPLTLSGLSSNGVSRSAMAASREEL